MSNATLQHAIEYGRDILGYPYWQLYRAGQYGKPELIASSTLGKDDATETERKASFEQLNQAVQFYNAAHPNTRYEVVYRKAFNSNGGGVMAPFHFTIDGNAATPQAAQPQPQAQPLAGIDGNRGYMSREDVAREIAEAIAKERREMQLEQREKALAEREKELQELRKVYTSNKAWAKDALNDAIPNVLMGIAEHFGIGGKGGGSLAGASVQIHEGEDEDEDDEEDEDGSESTTLDELAEVLQTVPEDKRGGLKKYLVAHATKVIAAQTLKPQSDESND